LDISGEPTPTDAVMKLPFHNEGLGNGGPIESTKGPAFVRNDFFKGTAELTDYGGIFWISDRQQGHHANYGRNFKDPPNPVLVEGPDPACPQAFGRRTERDVVHRNGDVDRITRLAAGHHKPVRLGAAGQHHRRLGNK
jgi:hypothetical protein